MRKSAKTLSPALKWDTGQCKWNSRQFYKYLNCPQFQIEVTFCRYFFARAGRKHNNLIFKSHFTMKSSPTYLIFKVRLMSQISLACSLNLSSINFVYIQKKKWNWKLKFNSVSKFHKILFGFSVNLLRMVKPTGDRRTIKTNYLQTDR